MSGHGSPRPEDKANHPGRKVVRDNAIVDVQGTPTRRQYQSTYDEAGKFVSQSYTHHGPAEKNEVRSGTWKQR
jgi:hypothetical protein